MILAFLAGVAITLATLAAIKRIDRA